MLRYVALIATTSLSGLLLLAGCPTDADGPLDPVPVTNTSGVVQTSDPAAAPPPSDNDESPASSAEPAPAGDDTPAPPPSEPNPTSTTRHIGFDLIGSESYRLVELGPSARGDRWWIRGGPQLGDAFICVLFDADHNLLMRRYVTRAQELMHTMRADTSQLILGVMVANGRNGGYVDFETVKLAAQNVPAPAQQIVYLNFAGASNVSVHGDDPISFGPFDAADIDSEYAGQTQAVKDLILAEMRADYDGYDVVFISSDAQFQPTAPHATLHFGGSSPGLLGLADSVDNYNSNRWEQALIYTDNFHAYWTMQLSADEMAIMIANVASHELGHLLGLYHTRDPNDIMDTTGSAWDLAENLSFIRAPLEQSVFIMGFEDCPALLAHALGTVKSSSQNQRPAKGGIYSAIRDFAADELRDGCACGTCQRLNDLVE